MAMTKIDNLCAALAHCFIPYNFCRIHKRLPTSAVHLLIRDFALCAMTSWERLARHRCRVCITRVTPPVSLYDGPHFVTVAAMPHYIFESRALKTRPGPIAGVDEAGRGPLAGPVVAAAVIFERKRIPKGLDDSKQMTAEAREEAYLRIMEVAIVGVGEASVDEIDLINIRQATHLAMARAIRALATAPDFALVDGNDAPALPCKCDTIIDGDARSVSIAAASIIAKVTRDRMMRALHDEHPLYGWSANKGYATPEHLKALSEQGPCVHHRRSFAPVHNILYGGNPVDSILTL
jgi:ribonuclease HII